MTYPLVRDLAAEGISVRLTCGVLGDSTQAYYAWVKQPVRSFRAVLTAAGLQGSMGRVAATGDNAAMESFNLLLQKNILNRRRWRTRDELHDAVVHWVEHTYNNRRRQRRLGKLTPPRPAPPRRAGRAAPRAGRPLALDDCTRTASGAAVPIACSG